MATPQAILPAAKLTFIEALRNVFDAEFASLPDGKPFPRRIDMEFAENEEDWPFILVSLRIQNLSWTGVNPDEFFPIVDDPYAWQRFRHGVFDAFLDLSIYALTSEERDRMWDTVAKLFMTGRMRPETKQFYDRVETGELIGMTVMEGSLEPQGDSVGMGTPWADERLSYEATIRVGVVGEFYTDEADGKLLPLTQADVHDTMQNVEPKYGEDDGRGAWVGP